MSVPRGGRAPRDVLILCFHNLVLAGTCVQYTPGKWGHGSNARRTELGPVGHRWGSTMAVLTAQNHLLGARSRARERWSRHCETAHCMRGRPPPRKNAITEAESWHQPSAKAKRGPSPPLCAPTAEAELLPRNWPVCSGLGPAVTPCPAFPHGQHWLFLVRGSDQCPHLP